MPGRRAIAGIAGVLGAGALAVVGVVMFLRPERGSEQAAREGAPSVAAEARGGVTPPSSAPRAAEAPCEDAPAPVPEKTTEPSAATRNVEDAPQVSFSGLVRIDGGLDGSSIAGSLVLRGDASSDAGLRIELRVKRGQFTGRGPASARVAVERLTIGDRNVVTRAEAWDLSSRWIRIEGTLATTRLLHVVDEEGHDLSHVALLDAQHSEEVAPLPGGRLVVMEGRRSSPPEGWDSPIRVAPRAGERHGFGIASGSRSPQEKAAEDLADRECVVRVPGRGIEFVRFAEDELEKRVVLHAPATVRVHVTPKPPPESPAAPRSAVVLALVVPEDRAVQRNATIDAATPDRRPVVTDVDALPAEVRAHLSASALARVRSAIELRRQYEAALSSPMRHVAAVDEAGIATFTDVGRGEWAAWCTDGRDERRSNVVMVGSRVVARGPAAPPRQELASFSTTAGGTLDVTVHAEPRQPALCTLVVHGSATSNGAAFPIDARRIAIVPLESDEPFEEDSIRPVDAGNDEGEEDEGAEVTNVERTAPVGLAWITVAPGIEHGVAPQSVLVDLLPGRNDVAMSFPQLQGVQVEFVLGDVTTPGSPDWNDAYWRLSDLRVRQGDVELEPRFDIDGGSGHPPVRVFLVFGPLAPGPCELIVPDDAGFDRPGTTTLEVAAHQLTKITLRSTLPSVAERRAGK